MDENNEFDIDSGVADIAADMGWGDSSDNDDLGGEVEGAEVESEDDSEGLPAEPGEEPAPGITTKAPPASWAKEQHEHWSSLSPEVQAYIELREKQVADGMNGHKEIKSFADEIQRTLAPFQDEIRANGLTEAQAITNLMGTHRVLTQGPLEARQQAFVELGRSIGLIPNEGQAQVDPQTQQLQQRIARMEQQEQLRQQQVYQQEHAKVMSDLEAFAADSEHAYFDEVAEDMLPLLKPGMSMADVKAVYDKAVWANPVTRAKEQAKLVEARTKALTEKQKAEATKAQKARSANVRGANTNRTSSDPTGSFEETMAETLAKIKSRS